MNKKLSEKLLNTTSDKFFVIDAEGRKIHISKLKIGTVVYHVDKQEFGHIKGFERLKLSETHNYLNIRVEFAIALSANKEISTNTQNLLFLTGDYD